MAKGSKWRRKRQQKQEHGRGWRGAGSAIALGLAALLGSDAAAICDVVPQPEVLFRGETGSLNRVYASPGDPVRVSIDTAGCEAGSAGFQAGSAGGAATDFNDYGLAGWTADGSHGSFLVQDVGIGPSLVGQLFFTSGQGARAPPAYLGDWTARGISQLQWIWAGFEDVTLSGATDVVRISGPGGSAAWRPSPGYLVGLQAVLFSAGIDTSMPTGDWVLTSGTWSGLMADVDELVLVGDLGFFGFNPTYVLDEIQLVGVASTGSVATLVYEPPAGPANAVVIPAGGDCGALAAEVAACQAALGAGTAVCRDDLSPNAQPGSFSFTMPDQGFAGPVTVAISSGGSALPCGLATTTCGGPGAPAGLLACIDALYASDGTCESDLANRHPQFPGLTALPARNDFSGICDSANPSIPCSNSGVDVQLTTDAEGNLVVPVDWRGVLVPGTLPIPRLVRASTLVPAFSGPPPEPAQTPGAPIQVPGLGFLQSFSPKGLRVDPLFNPLFGEDASTQTELFGSADAEFGVIRVLRRSPESRQCQAGDNAGLPCIADVECPNSQCVPAVCRGGANDGKACTGDGQCPGGECGASLFDFSDRYSNGGTGPILLTSAEYDAEALNPAAIEGLAATDELFSFVRSEPLEGADVNNDGDATDDTIVVLQNARDGTPADISWNVGGTGRASARVRNGLFRFPPLAVEGGIAAFLEAEAWERGIPLNGDSDSLDSLLRVYDLEAAPVAELTAGLELAVSTIPGVNDRSVVVSDGLVFFRESEKAGSRWFSSFQQVQTGGIFAAGQRWYAYQNDTSGLCDPSQVRVLDRDSDLDGLYDEGTGPRTTVSVDANGNPGNGWAYPRAISADGRFVLFDSDGTNLQAPPPVGGNAHAFLHDRDLDEDGIFDEPGQIETVWVDQNQLGQTCIGAVAENPVGIAVSDDGRWVTYLVPGTGYYILNRDADGNGVFGDHVRFPLTDLLPVGALVARPVVSPDARHIAFGSSTNNLVPGDTNDAVDWFVLDRDTDEDGVLDEPGFTSLASPSRQTNSFPTAGASRIQGLSDDGRILLVDEWQAFATYDRDADGNGIFDEPGTVLREVLPIEETGHPGAGAARLSDDGRWVFLGPESVPWRPILLDRTNLVHDSDMLLNAPDDFWDVLSFDVSDEAEAVAGYNFGDGNLARFSTQRLNQTATGDRNADGDQRDLILAVGDATQGPNLVVTYLGAAEGAVVDGGNAAFLMPEEQVGPGGTDLNGDADVNDAVVHVYRNRQPPAVNLGVSAAEVAVSDQVVAALVSEAGEGLLLNGDGDQSDLVVHVNDLATGTSGSWQNLFVAADAVQARGPYVAFTVPEWSQGASQNGDGDTNDRVLRVYDANAASYVAFQDEFGSPLAGLAVDDFVLGDGFVAFRVNEQGEGQNLNGVVPPIPAGVADGDLLDSVMHVADLATGTVYNTTQAAIPCPVEACDPRIPYRLQDGKVTYLTLEGEQGGNDLDQNGDGGTGLVLQHFNAAALVAGGSLQDACDVVGGAMGGFCTNTFAACASNDDCGGSTCYFPPGGCLLDLAAVCDTNPDDGLNLGLCGAGEICVPTFGQPGRGSCHAFQGPCLDDGQCVGAAFCTDNGADPEALFAAVGDEPDGRQRFVSEGRCSDGDGACANDGDCNEGAICDAAITVIATAADADADGLADPIDNCPDVANGDQLDVDGDGVGDACDRQSCGNAVQEYGETCDHGDQNGLDGLCDAACAYVGPGPACSDGVDNDGDGRIDAGAGNDPGCSDPADLSERDPGRVCDDGRDNDGDYGVDTGDLGCGNNPAATREDPACSNGLDDDGDGLIDWDGGGFGPKDPQCTYPFTGVEKKKQNCGVGAELLLVLPLLAGVAFSRRRGRGTRP